MGAGVGPLIAPAVFRIVVDFKDREGKISPVDCKPSADPSTPSIMALSLFLKELADLKLVGGPVPVTIPPTIPIPHPVTPAPVAAPGATRETSTPAVASWCKPTAVVKGPTGAAKDRVVWLPIRKDPGDPTSPMTGGLFLIRGDMSLAEAEHLNCGLDTRMQLFNKVAERLKKPNSSTVTVRASANIGPAATEKASDWGNTRDVSSSVSPFCPPRSDGSDR